MSTSAWRAWPVAFLTGACASPGLPPGGPVDKAPPALVSVSPERDAVNLTRLKEVVFRFDEVVSERPRGAASLDQLVTVSPSEGALSVDWRREAIAIRPKKGWRPNTAYTITIAPGMTDLMGNVDTKGFGLVFSTGAKIPDRALRGTAFDWVAQKPAIGGRVEATLPGDTLLRWVARVDSTGRWLLEHLPAGALRLRSYIDQNNNRLLDRTEKWDSVTVAPADSAPREVYLFEHDSLGPSLGEITRGDSTSLKVKFTRPLMPATVLDSTNVRVMRLKDSTYLRVRTVSAVATFDSLLQRRKEAAADSALRADTTAAGRRARATADSLKSATRADSIKRAQAAEIAKARDTTKRVEALKPTRPAPIAEVVLELYDAVLPNVPLQISVRDITGLSGARRSSQRQFTYRPPPEPAKKDTTKAPTGAKPTPGKPAAGATPVVPATPPGTAPKKETPIRPDTIGARQ